MNANTNIRLGHLITVRTVITGALLFVSGGINAASSPYSFNVDNFASTSFEDDFADGTLDSRWEIFNPTVVESGGKLTFSNPGTTSGPFTPGAGTGSFPFVGQSVSSEMSYVGYFFSGALDPLDGGGNFTGTSSWTLPLPGSNQFYTMGVGIEGADEDVGISVSNFNSQLGIGFGRFRDVQSGDYENQGVPILASDITGQILLRIAFDDSTNLLSGTYSLDGGSTFVSPFNPVSLSAGGRNPHWYLGSESWEVVPIPAAAWLFGSAVVTIGGLRRKRRSI